MENIGSQLKLPKDDIEGIKLAASGSSSKRDYLSFECAMKDEGQGYPIKDFLFKNFMFS